MRWDPGPHAIEREAPTSTAIKYQKFLEFHFHEYINRLWKKILKLFQMFRSLLLDVDVFYGYK